MSDAGEKYALQFLRAPRTRVAHVVPPTAQKDICNDKIGKFTVM